MGRGGLIWLTGLLIAGCTCQAPIDNSGAGGGGGGDATGGGQGGGDVPVATSSTANVRFKRNVRLTNDIAQALNLGTTQVCNELGQYACTTLVHSLALGGVDPYASGLYEPIPFTGVTSPIVVDRVGLSACNARVNADLAGDPVIFKNIAIADGKTDIDAALVDSALVTLYQRALLRDPTDAEKAHHKQLYRDILASGKPDPAKAWMTLSCFTVITSAEFLFY